MGKVIFKYKDEDILFETPGLYGSDLKIDVFDYNNKVYIVKDVPMTEVIFPVEDFSTTVTSDTAQGEKVLPVDSTDGLNASDRIAVGGEIYKVIKIIDANNVELNKGLVEDIAADTDVTRVGNSGVYSVRIYVTQTGVFVLNAHDTKYGIQRSDSITVKDKTIEDMFSDTNVEINENERIIKSTNGFKIVI